MLGADLLLVEEYGSAWPSKTLQYLRAGRPILAFVPRDGMIREVLETVPLGAKSPGGTRDFWTR